jgi:hypothetical protein
MVLAMEDLAEMVAAITTTTTAAAEAEAVVVALKKVLNILAPTSI